VARTSGALMLPMALGMSPTAPQAGPLVLGAALDLDAVARVVSGSQGLRQADGDGIVKVFDTNGVLLAAYPPMPPGKRPAVPFRQAVLAAIEGAAEVPAHDGAMRLVGFAHAGEGGTVYAVSALSDAVTRPASQRYRTVAAMGVLAWLAGLILAFRLVEWRVLEPLAVLLRAARAAQAGTHHPVSQERLPHEFEVLRRAMAAMMDAVESREATLQQANRDLARLAERDALTGIANRRAFDEALAGAWTQALEAGESLALAIVDVDFFKRFNDRYGHLRGDDCLRKVAQVLAGVRLRERDMAARMGGEEFVLLLPGTETEGAVAVAERALDAIRDRMMLHEDSPAGIVTVSIGVAACRPLRGLDAAALVAAADAALYGAKSAGRDQVVTAGAVARETAALAA
jgi:diguanylate cyclase (GGDEF)-like protein